ncbi:Epsin, putative [Candida maltosa Xu316]|uniref:Epsin, putative n=1 Tax=Candida maltosa (strain Xu316) TaxID=1245528 RepID=M3K772_CANMX|nr:Epsin, putative [Candida maltosa Xu316]
MDLLKDAAKNLNLYEVKAYVRKAQNAMNLTEMEAKVREATNNEPWGAPSTLMAQIAAGTYNYREREEIIGFIFRRFTEKAANEWRQIYKSLQLLEYLLKNGSERIIDDVRANLSLIQMLKSFHYIDSKGRDQGINVRNKSKNLIAFLNDDNLIRTERKKARQNAKKFGGVSSAAYGGASSVGGGFGSSSSTFSGDDEDFSNRVYGDGGVYGERYDDSAAEYKNGATGNDQFEEYDVHGSSSSGASKPTTGASKVNAKASRSKQPAAAQPPQDDLLGDLLSFDQSSKPTATTTADDDDDDDFDDFQAAPSQPQKPVTNNLSNLYNAPQQQRQQQQQQQFFQQPQQSTFQQPSFQSPQSSGPAKPSNDAFASLFSSAKTKSSHSTPAPVTTSTTTNNSTTTTSNSNTNTNTTLNAGEIDDLLSF